MGLGKMIIAGCIAATAGLGGHELFACELSQAPKPLGAIASAAAVERKPAKLVPAPRGRVERRARVDYSPFPSRRIILQ